MKSSSLLNKIYHALFDALTLRTAIAVILGNVILGFGEALLKISTMGNEPFSAFMIATSGRLGFGLGNFQITCNLIMLLIQLKFGRKYIGFGSLINLAILGYITQGSLWFLHLFISPDYKPGLLFGLILMIVALAIISLGISMYQLANLGVSPYDYMAIGLTDYFPKRSYSIHRMMVDGTCVLVLVVFVLIGFMTFTQSNLGVGTFVGALCLGPMVAFFNQFNRKWIR